MTSHADLRGWTPMIRETLLTRRMPPWQADPRHGSFVGDMSLSPEELSALIRWIDSGAPRGEGPDPLSETQERTPQDWPLGQPDIILSMKDAAVIPASGTWTYQYYPLTEATDRELWIQSIDIRPENPRVVHHAWLLDFPTPPAQHERNQKSGMMAAIRRFKTPEGRIRALWNWNPGRLPAVLPEGVAIRVPKGRYLVLEIHYNPIGRQETDKTKLGLYLYRGKPAPKELKFGFFESRDFMIPPQEKDHPVGPFTAHQFRQNSYLLSLRPHMHYRGARMKAAARYPDGQTETLLSVPSYDFNWQHSYILTKPKLLPVGTTILVGGSFDNSSSNPANPDPNRKVSWGLSGEDEMFILYFSYFDAP